MVGMSLHWESWPWPKFNYVAVVSILTIKDLSKTNVVTNSQAKTDLLRPFVTTGGTKTVSSNSFGSAITYLFAASSSRFPD
jgi:hypothetical protein